MVLLKKEKDFLLVLVIYKLRKALSSSLKILFVFYLNIC